MTRWGRRTVQFGLLLLLALSSVACSSQPEMPPAASAATVGLHAQLAALHRQIELQRQETERLSATQRQLAEAVAQLRMEAWTSRQTAAIAPNLQDDGQGRWCRVEKIRTYGEQSGWSEAALRSCWDPQQGQWVLEQP